MTIFGLLVVLAGALSYLTLVFVLRRFTYGTWKFHAAIAMPPSAQPQFKQAEKVKKKQGEQGEMF